MANVSRDSRTNSLYIYFRFGGKAFKRTLKTDDERDADRVRVRVEDTLAEIAKGRLVLPEGADVVHFVMTGGKQAQPPQVTEQLTLDGLFDWYFASIPDGAKEANTLATERIHRKHLVRLFGRRRACEVVTKADLQKYIQDRAREKYGGKPIRAETIKKELDTLRSVWNRAHKMDRVKRALDFDGLDWPRTKDKPAFQTREQIEQAVARGGLSEDRVADLWDSLFLAAAEVEALLDHVRDHGQNPTLYALMVFLAHTGARKSEAIRCQVSDVRFDDGVVVIREKKRTRGRDTTRRIDLTDRLRDVLKDYLQNHHPGGNVTFCYRANEAIGPNNLYETWDWFFRGRKGAEPKWAVLRGFHVLRHSFASNLARAGVDQRVIDELMGHETEAMRKRYRHLFPDQTRDAVRRVFG